MDCEKILAEQLERAKTVLNGGKAEPGGAEFDCALITVVLGLAEDNAKAKKQKNNPATKQLYGSGVASDIPYIELVNEKLRESGIYLGYYQKTGKEKFRQIARQDLGHATALLEDVESKSVASELRAKLRELEKKIE